MDLDQSQLIITAQIFKIDDFIHSAELLHDISLSLYVSLCYFILNFYFTIRSFLLQTIMTFTFCVIPLLPWHCLCFIHKLCKYPPESRHEVWGMNVLDTMIVWMLSGKVEMSIYTRLLVCNNTLAAVNLLDNLNHMYFVNMMMKSWRRVFYSLSDSSNILS